MNIWQVSSGEVTGNFQNNFIRWSDHFEEETGFDGDYTLAVTIRYTQIPYITKMEIILNGNIEYLRNNEDDTLKKTILHEMGHSIGLDHSTNQSIMNAYITNLDSLQEDDKLGAVALLGKMADSQKKSSVVSLKPTTTNNTSDALNNVNACGSVSLTSGGNSGGGAGGFMGSLILGLLLVFSFKLIQNRKILPSRALIN
ncbi:MAG: matrixin family metalloprotease [Bacteriovoracaceae bacterium]